MNKPRKPLLHHLHDYFLPHERNSHCPHLFSITSLAVLTLAIVIIEAGYLVQTKIVFLKTDFLASVLPGALVALTNQDRATSGLVGVTEDSLLDKAAQAAAEDMATNGYFAHVSPDGKDPWYWLNQAGYKYSYAGENLAVNFTDSQNVETAWMESPTHRANIEKPQYTEIGIGTANGIYEGKETTFVVSFFAAPAAGAELASALPAKVAPPQKQVSTGSVTVLGSQTVGADAGSAAGADAINTKNTPTPIVHSTEASQNWLASLLASPFDTLEMILTIILAVVAVSFSGTVFIRGKAHHPRAAFGCAFLFLFISGTLFFTVVYAGPVLVQ